MQWLITNMERILESPGDSAWMARWLEVLKTEAQKGFHPETPRFAN